MVHVKQLVADYKILPANIYSLDETAPFLDHGRDDTIDVRGSQHVAVWFCLMFRLGHLAQRSLGSRACWLHRHHGGNFFLRCSSRVRDAAPIRTVSGVRFLCNQRAWMNEDAFIQWIDHEFPFVAPDTILLVFDSARSHISNKVKNHLQARRILRAVIPGGLTGLLQPCDVYWFKRLKDSIAKDIDAWKRDPNHELARGKHEAADQRRHGRLVETRLGKRRIRKHRK